MKKIYEAPELKLVRFTIADILSGSQEGAISSQIGGDDDYGDDLLDGMGG